MASVVTPVDRGVVIANVSWRTYVNLVEDLAERTTPRLTFDRGTLEIMSPTKKHERLNRVLAQLVEVSTDELDLSVDSPPELVIEIDVTSAPIDKDPIYAQMGVREVWRYDAGSALES